MKITLLQRDTVWGDPKQNSINTEEALKKYTDTDLFILPEMFSTGFVTNPAGIAESADGISLNWMKKVAAEKNCAICGSVAVEENGCFYNRFYFVEPDGTVHFYNKHHLFTYGGEHKTYTAGNERVIVNYKGIRIQLLVCYDLRFPTWARNQKDYDMIIYVASWPSVRRKAWSTLLEARAIENQCFVAGVNRTGTDPYCIYNGGSRLIDPYGETIAACVDNKECEATGEINMEVLNAFRAKFPVLDDRD